MVKAEEFFKKHAEIIIALGIIAGALVLRLYSLNRFDLWFDELLTARWMHERVISHSQWLLVGMWEVIAKLMENDPHSILYYFFVFVFTCFFKGWQALRLLSVIFSIAALIIGWRMARLYFDRLSAMIFLLLMGLSPIQIWYAQEARAYSAAAFFFILAVWFYLKMQKVYRKNYWWGFVLSFLVSLYLNYFTVFLMPLIIVDTVFFGQNKKSKILSGMVVLIFLSLPLCILLPGQIGIVRDNFWLTPPTAVVVLNTFRAFTLGFSANYFWHNLGLATFSACYLYGAKVLYKENRRKATSLIIVLFFPIMIIFLFSKVFFPIYLDRQLLIFSPYYYLLIAYGVKNMRGKVFRALVCVLILTVLACPLANYYQGNIMPLSYGVWKKKEYRNFIEKIQRSVKKNDLIIVTDVQAALIINTVLVKEFNFLTENFHFLFYRQLMAKHDLNWLSAGTVKNLDVDSQNEELFMVTYKNRTKSIEKADNIENLEKSFKEINHIWVFSTTWADVGVISKNSKKVIEKLDKQYVRIFSIDQDGIYVKLYKNRKE